MGFTADVVIWDLENRQLLHRMALHKVRGAPPPINVDVTWLRHLGLTALLVHTYRSRFRHWHSHTTNSTSLHSEVRTTTPW
jgi:hypothetical protein